MRLGFALLCLCALAAMESPAERYTFTIIASFNGMNGYDSYAPLVQAFDGKFYGTTFEGINDHYGTIFRVTPKGTLTGIYSFNLAGGANGAYPEDGLIQGTDGKLYGTTTEGGYRTGSCYSAGCGTVFAITPAGVLTALHQFVFTDGNNPYGLVQGASGDFFGVTYAGGIGCQSGCGTIFKITRDGGFILLHAFDSTDGAQPDATLVQGSNLNLYGATYSGGAIGYGTVFQITPTGTLTTLHSFTGGADGAYPLGGVIEGFDGYLYGTTYMGGENGRGTFFRIGAAGVLTTLYAFNDQPASANPNTPLVQAPDGNFYGTSGGGGTGCTNGCGTIFKITPSGNLTTLYSFDYTTGFNSGGLMQATDGNFYGTTSGGAALNYGGVFRLSLDLAPFVKTVPIAGAVGSQVRILGTNLTSPASVTFNGTPATVTSVLPSQIIAVVPSGATTGRVEVTLPSGTLKSNVPFLVPR